jgi:hypothetical protein
MPIEIEGGTKDESEQFYCSVHGEVEFWWLPQAIRVCGLCYPKRTTAALERFWAEVENSDGRSVKAQSSSLTRMIPIDIRSSFAREQRRWSNRMTKAWSGSQTRKQHDSAGLGDGGIFSG